MKRPHKTFLRCPKATCLGLLVVLCQTGLLLTPTAQAQAFGRLNPVLTGFPIANPSPNGAPGALAMQHLTFPWVARSGNQSVLVAAPSPGRVFEVNLAGGTTTLLAGNGRPGGELDGSSALNSSLDNSGPLCALRDGSFLLADNTHFRVLQIRPGGAPWEPATVAVFAGTGQPGDGLDPNAALQTQLSWVVSMIERQDGSILMVDGGTSRILRFFKGAVSVFHRMSWQDPDLFDYVALLALDDQSVLLADTNERCVLRIGNDGVATIYAGGQQVPAEFKGLEPEYRIEGLRPIGLALAPDGSVLVAEDRLSGRLLRLKAGVTTVMTGATTGHDLLDPQYLNGAYPLLRPGGLATFQDGSILFPIGHGVFLLSPSDDLQGVLEKLVERGKAAVDHHHPAEFKAAESHLEYLCNASQNALRAVSREGREDRLAASGHRPALYADLLEIIRAHADRPVEKFRAQLALKELRAYRQKGVAAHSSEAVGSSGKP